MFKKIKDFFRDSAKVELLTEAELLLKERGIKYEKKPDGTLFVPGSIILPRKNLTRLPDLSSVEVGRDFFCNGNQLTSLEGCPKSVGRNFWCNGNQLTSLKGVPQSVKGCLLAYDNPLTSLEHAPQNSKMLFTDLGNFDSWENVPDALKISPETIEREKQAQLQKELQERERRESDIRDATVLKDAVKPSARIKLKK